MLRITGLLAVVVLALTAAPARADCVKIRWVTRWQPDMTGAIGGSLVHGPVCEERRAPKPHATKRNPKPPTKAQYRALQYAPSESVSATVRQRMIGQLA